MSRGLIIFGIVLIAIGLLTIDGRLLPKRRVLAS